MMKEFFQHLYIKDTDRSIQVKPRITICYLRDEINTYVGMSICAMEDNPCKAVGRKISRDRAWAAYNGYSLPVFRGKACLILGKAVNSYDMSEMYIACGGGTYDKAFTVYEDTEFMAASRKQL